MSISDDAIRRSNEIGKAAIARYVMAALGELETAFELRLSGEFLRLRTPEPDEVRARALLDLQMRPLRAAKKAAFLAFFLSNKDEDFTKSVEKVIAEGKGA